MTVFDWLASPIGQDVQHAVIALVLAVAAYLTYLTHRTAKDSASKLDEHLDTHTQDVVDKSTGGHNT